MSWCVAAVCFGFLAGCQSMLALGQLAKGRPRCASGEAIAACVLLGVALWLVR